MPPSLLAAGTTQGAAGLGSGKQVGSGNSLGGAASPWASACAAPVPALGWCPCAGGAAVPPPPVPTPRVPSPGKARTDLRGVRGGGWWLAVVTIQRVSVQCCVHLRACQGGGVSTRCPPVGCTPLEHPSWCAVRTHLGVPVDLFGLGVLLGALLPTQTGGSELGGHGRGVPRGAGWCWGAHLGTLVGQGAALLQLAEEEDGTPRAAGGQRLPADLRRRCAEGTCWGRTPTAGSTQPAPGGAQGGINPPEIPHLEKV